jgi:predicted phage replisome organizer
MSANTPYFYMRLKADFFESDEIIILEEMPKGYLYENILFKMYLKSLKHNGRLVLNEKTPYTIQTLSKVIRHSEKDTKEALDVLSDLGLVDIIEATGVIFMSNIQNYIGKSSTEADRKRVYRNQIEKEKKEAMTNDKCPDKCPDKTPPYIDIDTNIDTNINNNCVKSNPKKEIDECFERLWKEYPNKRGKGQISEAKKKKLFEVGEEHIKKAIERYLNDLSKESWRQPQNGSTFFNSGYVDYLDENYEKPQELQQRNPASVLSCEHDYDFDSLERQLLNKQWS